MTAEGSGLVHEGFHLSPAPSTVCGHSTAYLRGPLHRVDALYFAGGFLPVPFLSRNVPGLLRGEEQPELTLRSHEQARVLLGPGGIAREPGRLGPRSEEHTSERQSRQYLGCRLLLE